MAKNKRPNNKIRTIPLLITYNIIQIHINGRKNYIIPFFQPNTKKNQLEQRQSEENEIETDLKEGAVCTGAQGSQVMFSSMTSKVRSIERRVGRRQREVRHQHKGLYTITLYSTTKSINKPTSSCWSYTTSRTLR
eukprot:TRINITY_DN4767_c0_g1_i2.p1 TRINITY_DN4767_c0_g1~~TRINITY_DN4767_c0_g1_i2.p1  ORF type:complete len:135 (-),score=16.57 TRINITY_DN4767_c0_g1_i2:17-421(-)